jgi:hypothetical protein
MVIRAAYTSLEVPTHTDWNSYVLNGALQYLAEYNVTSLVSAIGMDYAFSYPATQYRNFRVVLGDLSSSVASVILVQMQNGTVPAGPALYNYAVRNIDTAATVTTSVGVNGFAFVLGPIGTSATLKSYYVFDICTPQSGFATTIQGRGGTLGDTQTNFSGQLNNTIAYDGLSITAFGTTIQGTCQVYGYRTEL